MANDGEGHKYRAYKPKVRSGCKTCKQRRVKCDEQAPACRRCISSGRLCDGYNTLRMAVGSSGLEGTVIRWQQQPSVNVAVSRDPLEQAAFTAFRERCTRHNGTMLENNPLHSYFCQTAHTEPAVWHAIVALESLGHGRNEFANQQYGKAMVILQQKISDERRNANISAVLIASLLFTSFELVREGYSDARTHLRGALKLLAESRDRPTEAPYGSSMIPTTLWESFERLDCHNSSRTNQRTVLNQRAVDDLAAYPSIATEGLEGHSRTLILALAATMELYDKVRNTGADPELEGMQAKVGIALSKWDADMEALESQVTEMVKQQRLRMCQMYCLTCKIHVATLHLYGKHKIIAAYERFNTDFRRCLALCKAFLDAGAVASTAYTQFSIHNGVILPLFFIAVKCRETDTRQEALELLQRCHHREGWWCGKKAARVAELAVRGEEKGTPQSKDGAGKLDVARQLEATFHMVPEGTMPPLLPMELLSSQFALVPDEDGITNNIQ